jgi:transcriptional regulatory protein RtcR
MGNSSSRKAVVIGVLGPTLDRGFGPDRWNEWRPTVSLFQHEDLLVDRFELLHQRQFAKLVKRVVDDIALVSPETEVRLHEVELRDPWDFGQVYGALLDWARDYPFDLETEDYLVHITTGTHVVQICLFLLAESRAIPAKLVQTAPPPGGLRRKGPEFRVIDLDLSRYDPIADRFLARRRDALSFLKSGIDTRNAAFNALIERIERVAVASAAPLLLLGPTGAGKSRLARRIHELKKERRQLTGGFVEVNCATIRGDGAMSALFGHERGSFTGATGPREGLLRRADGGVLFLDEVGELGVEEQAMLLGALETKRFRPLGSDREAASDFQLICGTNRDLAVDVHAGRFRDDLLARLNLWTFRLPSLAERPEDIEPNLDYELARHAERHGTHVRFNREARARFLDFATSGEALWAANFRDLSAAVTRMATLAEGARIAVRDVEEEIARLRAQWRAAAPAPAGKGTSRRDEATPATLDLDELLGADVARSLDRFDRVQLAEVVAVCRRSRSLSEAGRTLFAASRTRRTSTNDADRLRKYLARFSLTWDRLGVGA